MRWCLTNCATTQNFVSRIEPAGRVSLPQKARFQQRSLNRRPLRRIFSAEQAFRIGIQLGEGVARGAHRQRFFFHWHQ